VPTTIPTKGKGWDATHIYVGMTNESDVEGAAAALGLSLDPGNVQGDMLAAIAAVNKAGGLFGRQLVPLIDDNSTAALLADPNGTAQGDCTYFTQDHSVVAVFNIVTLLDVDSFRSCLADSHTPFLESTIEPFDNTDFSTYSPYLYTLLVVSYDQIAPLLISHLGSEGYFAGWNTGKGGPGSAPVKVGLLYTDSPRGQRIAGVFKQLLAQAGHPVVASFAVSTDSSTAEAQGTPAVLQMEGAGVTHLVDTSGGEPGFAISAQAQHYFPRYAVTSYEGIQPQMMGNDPASQLVGALGIGWAPSLDVNAAQDPGGEPGAAACNQVMSAGGMHATARFAQAVMDAICDGVQLIVRGATAGGGLDPASLQRGLGLIGPTFPTALGFASGLSATRPEVPGAARDIGYETSCSCFEYSGPTFPL
jgi:hypothetical protein